MKRDILFKWTGAEQFIEDGYYIDGQQVPVPDGYWLDDVNGGLPNGYYVAGVLTPLPECAEVGAIFLSETFDAIPQWDASVLGLNSGSGMDLNGAQSIELAATFDAPV